MASVISLDLKEAIDGYRVNSGNIIPSVTPETEELLSKLYAVVRVLERIMDYVNSGRLDLEEYLAKIKKLATEISNEISNFKMHEAELKRLANHVVDRTRIELIKINAY